LTTSYTIVYNLSYFPKGVILVVVKCVVCDGEVQLSDDVIEGELLTCPDCGSELEVVSLAPLSVEEAPEVQEDWGE